MKQLSFAFAAIILGFLLSCSDTKTAGSMSEKAKKNQETNKSVMRMFETGDFSRIDSFIAADAVDHSGPQGEVKGIDSIKAMFQYFTSMMSDTKIEVVKELADDDYVMTWINQSWTAKTDDPMMGMKAGDKGNMSSVEVTKYNNEGKVTDHWGFMGMSDVMKMMPQPSMAPSTTATPDTTKK